jgi:tetratricopeptide (TPR) repeat protein
VNRLAYLWLKLQAMAWLVFGRNVQALAVFDRMVQDFPKASYPRASRAHLHAQAGRHGAALDDYDALLRLDAADARTWFNKGFVLELTGRMDEALSAFRRATELSPELDRAWYGQGLVLIRLQRFDEAVAALKRNTELQPMSPHGWYQLARVHVDRKQPDEAVKIIRHLKGFEPKVAAQLERETGLLAGGAGPQSAAR